MSARIQTAAFDPGAETNAFLAESAGAGAAVTFTGLVRSRPDDPVETLTLESYPELAVNQIEAMIAEATTRFGLLRATVIHRYGTLPAGEPIVQVMTLAPHRQAAFEGAEFLMDFLKTEAPFWKKEATPIGERWVEAKQQDDAAKDRWGHMTEPSRPPFSMVGIDHVVFIVDDLEKAVKWYADVLGCQPGYSYPTLGMEQVWCGAALIVLWDITHPGAASAVPPVKGGRNVDHVCIALSPFDHDAMRAHLAAHGVTIDREAIHGGARGMGNSFYVLDPWGNKLELKGPAVYDDGRNWT